MTDTHETQTMPAQPTTSFWRRRPTLLIAGGLGAAALLVGGVGIGAAVADGDDDDRPMAAQRAGVAADDETDVPTASAGVPAATFGAADAGALSEVLAAARGEAKGEPISLGARRDGSWSVDLEVSNGDETTILVAADGTASVVRTEAADTDDADDPAPAGTLDDSTLAAIVDAASAEAEGLIVDVDLDDDPAEAYSVQVRAADGSETELDLATDFSVTKVDVDND